jgi:hypothetical protein
MSASERAIVESLAVRALDGARRLAPVRPLGMHPADIAAEAQIRDGTLLAAVLDELVQRGELVVCPAGYRVASGVST